MPINNIDTIIENFKEYSVEQLSDFIQKDITLLDQLKFKIFDNIINYSAEQLADFIRNRIVTLDELQTKTHGQFDVTKRRRVEKLLENGDLHAWEKAKQEPTEESTQLYLDTYPNGEYRDEARRLKKEIQEKNKLKENISAIDTAWQAIDKNNQKCLERFLDKYPNSSYEDIANKQINRILQRTILGFDSNTLKREIKEHQMKAQYNEIISTIKTYLNEDYISKTEFLSMIKKDNNLLDAGTIKRLMDDDVISLKDLVNIRIDNAFIQKMYSAQELQTFDSPEKLEKIHKKPTTEVYFWGIPSSGKSCALGAILSTAASGKGIVKSMFPDIQSQGHGYMNELKSLFENDEVGTLMGSTPIDAFYEMGFDAYDEKGNIYPFTFIDMAGELMRCMYKKNAGKHLNLNEIEMLDTLHNVLVDNRSDNRKIHIFVIEYGAENRKHDGLTQNIFLGGAASYIKNTGIFKNETDAIFIMLTKTDKAENNSIAALKQYIDDHYTGFYNVLEQICIDNEINGKQLKTMAFTLGEVSFQSYCRFNDKASENFLKTILQHSASYKNTKLEKLRKKLGK